MAITVPISMGYELEVKAKAAEVFEVLSDVPTSASFFPKVDKLSDLGDNTYQWEMEKVGTAQVSIQTVYASKYTSSKPKGTVTWKPVGVAASTITEISLARSENASPGVHCAPASFGLPLASGSTTRAARSPREGSTSWITMASPGMSPS